jgi:hypothetical protein
MKRAREHDTHNRPILQRFIRGATGIKGLRGRHRHAPAAFSVMSGRGRLRNAIVAVLSLALLLFSLAGVLAVITGAYALTPNQISAPSLVAGPMRRPPPWRSPTPTTVPSSTATAMPSPTFIATPTTMATVPASATPPVKTTVTSIAGKVGESQRLPVSTPLSSSTGGPAFYQKEQSAFLPLVMGIAAVVLLVITGLALRRWLVPVRKVKLPPSGAAPWQRVRPTGLDDSMNSPGYGGQKLPGTNACLRTTKNIIPSRMKVSSTTSHFAAKRRSASPAQHFLKPTRLKAINKSDLPASARASILAGQNSQPVTTIRERAKKREKLGLASARED